MGKNKKGWITLDRSIMEHWLYSDKPFDKCRAWIDLILIADHTTHTSIWRGQPTTFRRGDVNISISELSKRWGWSRSKTMRYLKQLETDGMLIVNSTTHRTTITLVKYGKYQLGRTTNDTTDDTTDSTTDESTGDTYLNNNKRIEKNKKEKEIGQPSEEVPDSDEEEDPDAWWKEIAEEEGVPLSECEKIV